MLKGNDVVLFVSQHKKQLHNTRDMNGHENLVECCPSTAVRCLQDVDSLREKKTMTSSELRCSMVTKYVNELYQMNYDTNSRCYVITSAPKFRYYHTWLKC